MLPVEVRIRLRRKRTLTRPLASTFSLVKLACEAFAAAFICAARTAVHRRSRGRTPDSVVRCDPVMVYRTRWQHGTRYCESENHGKENGEAAYSYCLADHRPETSIWSHHFLLDSKRDKLVLHSLLFCSVRRRLRSLPPAQSHGQSGIGGGSGPWSRRRAGSGPAPSRGSLLTT